MLRKRWHLCYQSFSSAVLSGAMLNGREGLSDVVSKEVEHTIILYWHGEDMERYGYHCRVYKRMPAAE